MTEPHIAGHAVHFLGRLDRVDGEHVELAMLLYNVPDLVHEVLRHSFDFIARAAAFRMLHTRHDLPIRLTSPDDVPPMSPARSSSPAPRTGSSIRGSSPSASSPRCPGWRTPSPPSSSCRAPGRPR